MKHCLECGGVLSATTLERKVRLRCPACGWVLWEDPKLAVAVLVVRDGSILFGRRGHDPGRGLWSFPAGFVDRGEQLEQAAVREVQEETGLTVRLGDLVRLWSAEGEPVVLAVYEGELVGGTLQPRGQLTELRWCSPDALPPLAFPHDYDILRGWCAARGIPTR